MSFVLNFQAKARSVHNQHTRSRRASERVVPEIEEMPISERFSWLPPLHAETQPQKIVPTPQLHQNIPHKAYASSVVSLAFLPPANFFDQLELADTALTRRNGSVALAHGVAIGGVGFREPLMVGMRSAGAGGGLGMMSQVGIRAAGAGDPCAVCPPGSSNDPLGAVMSLLRSSFDVVSFFFPHLKHFYRLILMQSVSKSMEISFLYKTSRKRKTYNV